MYLDFSEGTQSALGLGLSYGDNPLPTGDDTREPGGELGDRLKEKAGTEPDDHTKNYPVGLEVDLPDNGMYPRSVIRRDDGGFDTLQYGGNKNGKSIDTIHGPATSH